MSYQLLGQAYSADILALGLDEHALGVYRVLCNAHNQETGRCDPSTETVAAMLNVGLRTVERAYAALRSAGLITTEQKHDRRGYVSGLSFTILTACQAVRSRETQGGLMEGVTPDRLTGGAGAVCEAEPGPSDRRGNSNQEVNLESETDTETDTAAPRGARGGISPSQLSLYRDAFILCHRQEPSASQLDTVATATRREFNKWYRKLWRDAHAEYRFDGDIDHEAVRDSMAGDGSYALLSVNGRARLDRRAEKSRAANEAEAQAHAVAAWTQPKSAAGDDWWWTEHEHKWVTDGTCAAPRHDGEPCYVRRDEWAEKEAAF